jgi:hypothetical protein
MTRWFRVYEDLVDDPKVQRLDPSLFKAVVNLWCLASANGDVLPPLDVIAYKLRITVKKAQRLLDQFKSERLLDEDQTGLYPHNWSARQHKSDREDPTARERMQRYRNRQRNSGVTQPVTSRSPESEAETERSPSQGRIHSDEEVPIRANGRSAS